MQIRTGDFLPIVKYDARAGRFYKMEKRVDGGSDPIELPPGTKFAFDIGTLEAGFVAFTAQGPVRHMVPYSPGVALPPQPQDKDGEGKLMFRPGFWVKIAGNALDGVREWCSNAAVLLNALDELYQQITSTPEAAAGQIPIISISGTIAVKSGSGARSSTNYAPIFRLEGWTNRPDLLGERTVASPGPAPRAVGVPVSQMQPAQVAAMAAASVPAQQPISQAAATRPMADAMPF
jgi:hypothetical protein